MEAFLSVNRTDAVVEDPVLCNGSKSVQEKSASSILLCIVVVVLSLLIICGNLLVIITILYFKQLQTPTNYLILSLAVADLLVGVLVLPFSTILSLISCSFLSYLLCEARGLVDVLLSTSSILNLCIISVDRYYAVCSPLTYGTKMNMHVIGAMILVGWTLSALLGIGITFRGLNLEHPSWRCNLFQTSKESSAGPIFAFYIPAITILTINLKILTIAKKQARSIQNSTMSKSAVGKMERKADKTLAVVMGVFLICWAPFFVSKSFYHMRNNEIPILVIEAFKWLGWSNSMLNPFVYAFFYRWFRLAFKMIISGKIFQGDFSDSKLF